MYGLYHTLNTNFPDRDPTSEELEELKDMISNETDSERISAIVMLMLEHYRISNPEDELLNEILPYGIKTHDSEGITFNLVDIPHKLQWILYKFENVENKN